MKLNPTSRNLIGKLFFYELPVFRIGNIVNHVGDFTKILETNSDLVFSEPIIEEKNPTTILGKYSNTIKYNFVGFEDGNDIIEKFQIGVGENGYFYDMFIKPKLETNTEENSNYNHEKILAVVKYIEKTLINIFGKASPDFVRKTILNKPKEISNVVLNVEFSKNIMNLFNSNLNSLVNVAVKNSENIIPGINNSFGSLISFNIYPDPTEHAGIDIDKIVVPDRMITIRQEPIQNRNVYYIRFRGIPAHESLNFLESITEIVET